jgi:predicted acetyltransferase
MIKLIPPSLDRLDHYADALRRGWSPDNVRLAEAAKEELELIAKNPAQFVANQDDPEAKAGPVELPDGSTVQRLPGFRRWVWDGEFCGTFGFRRKPGTAELPPHVLGHLGYSIVPWKQKRGYATQGLKLLLQEIRKPDLPYVLITTDPDNIPSQKVVLANGGVLVERFQKPAAYGANDGLLFRIDL